MNLVPPAPDHDVAEVVLGPAMPVVVGCCAGGRSRARGPLPGGLDDVAAGGDGPGVVWVDVHVAPPASAAYGTSAAPSVVVSSAGTMLAPAPQPG